MIIPLLFVLLPLQTHVSGDVTGSVLYASDTAQRIDTERLLVEQAAEMAVLKRLVQELSTELTTQKRLLQQQSIELTSHKSLLKSQHVQLSDLENTLAEKDAELSEQNARLSLLEDTIFRQKDAPSRVASSSKWNVSRRQQDHYDLLFPTKGISRRADDAGPLEAVVSQISQQVTAMNADVQALKTSMNADVQALKTSVNRQDQNIQEARTSTFVRWGNSQCGSGSEMVYSGVVGGSFFSEQGAATNYLCLTLSPIATDHKSIGAHVYGAEYQTSDAVQDKDPVCAVCRAAFPTTIMIPGTNVCTPGWHVQYHGYLMAGGYHDLAGSEFICVDSALEYMIHSDQNENGKSLFFTSTVCGSLPCGPYVNGATVSCAVCSK